jgi:hypothetical protein
MVLSPINSGTIDFIQYHPSVNHNSCIYHFATVRSTGRLLVVYRMVNNVGS